MLTQEDKVKIVRSSLTNAGLPSIYDQLLESANAGMVMPYIRKEIMDETELDAEYNLATVITTVDHLGFTREDIEGQTNHLSDVIGDSEAESEPETVSFYAIKNYSEPYQELYNDRLYSVIPIPEMYDFKLMLVEILVLSIKNFKNSEQYQHVSEKDKLLLDSIYNQVMKLQDDLTQGIITEEQYQQAIIEIANTYICGYINEPTIYSSVLFSSSEPVYYKEHFYTPLIIIFINDENGDATDISCITFDCGE